MEDLLIGKDAAEYLGMTRGRLYQLARTEGLGTRRENHLVFTKQELDEYKARPKATGGRPQTTYRLTPAPAKQLLALAAKRGMHPEALLAMLIAEAARQEAQPLQDELAQLLTVLIPEPQSVVAVCKRLRMTKVQLELLIRVNMAQLRALGVQWHGATKSEVAQAIQLPSSLNADEPAYFSKLSRTLTP